jgi:CBS domain-containing protein
MTKDPVFVYDTDSSGAALCVMAVAGHRHVPVLDREHRIIGIVTPQRITSFLLSHADA